MFLLLALVLASCHPLDDVKSLGADIAEVSYCEIRDCGQVFSCHDGPLLGELEYCWIDDNPDELASELGTGTICNPSPRGGYLGLPCLYQCPSARGCNAHQGCYCP